jgi:hypothetical protein
MSDARGAANLQDGKAGLTLPTTLTGILIAMWRNSRLSSRRWWP